jgi:hypothetical protein
MALLLNINAKTKFGKSCAAAKKTAEELIF